MKAEYDFSNAKRGAVKPAAGKTRITIYLDDDVLTHFRDVATGEGLGYQTVINRALRNAMQSAEGASQADVPSLLAEIKYTLDEMKQRLPAATVSERGALYTGVDQALTRQYSDRGDRTPKVGDSARVAVSDSAEGGDAPTPRRTQKGAQSRTSRGGDAVGHPGLSLETADKLLDMLGSDDRFRELFVQDPAAALKQIGVMDVHDKTARLGVTHLAPKAEIEAARAELLQHLIFADAHNAIRSFEADNVVSILSAKRA
ncbi:NHLP-related RiPP peptide [Lysobacter sp. Root916]|uniref:NHLP-related RiPP peptide n=1 Tax=Lysobacter sp. Root916 TaxID=1736606 RepID=UPI000AD7EDB6|nr:NHLP-related RiPP peptide [Lysobacter sp. Root916]